jgi:hypothetical protein
MGTKTNYLAIAACAVVNMLLGMTWYGVFDDAWMAGHGLTMAEIEANASATPYIIAVVMALSSSFVMDLIFRRMGVSGWQDGAKTGAAFGFFVLMTFLMSYGFSQKPFSLSLLDGGFGFALFTLFGAIIGGGQKKS